MADGTGDWIEEAADSLHESELHRDEYGEKAQPAALQAIARALISIAGTLKRQEGRPSLHT